MEYLIKRLHSHQNAANAAKSDTAREKAHAKAERLAEILLPYGRSRRAPSNEDGSPMQARVIFVLD